MVADDRARSAQRIRAARENHYMVLDVASDASSEEIVKAYKRLAMLFHPDRQPKGLSERQAEVQRSEYTDLFQRIGVAFETLNNPESRRAFDRQIAGPKALVPYKDRDSQKYANDGGNAMDPYHKYSSNRRQSYQQPVQRTASEPAYQNRNSQAMDPYSNSGGYENPFRKTGRRFSNKAPSQDPFALFESMMGGNDPFGMGNSDPFYDESPPHAVSNERAPVQRGTRQTDPFALFNSMFGQDNNADPFGEMFNGLSMGEGGEGEGMPRRGGMAHRKITRKHTNSNGDVATSRQEHALGVFDMGSKGKVVVQSSINIRNFQPGRRNTAAVEDFDAYDSPTQSPYMSRSNSPEVFRSPSTTRRISPPHYPPIDSPYQSPGSRQLAIEGQQYGGNRSIAPSMYNPADAYAMSMYGRPRPEMHSPQRIGWGGF